MTARQIKPDGRSAPARRERELRAGLLRDLGGAAAISTAQRIAVDNLARVQADRECIAAAEASGAAIDPTHKAKLDSTIIRYQRQLGIDRRQPSPPATMRQRLLADKGAAT